MEDITVKQKEILNAIGSHIRNTGQSPTVREIGQAVNLRSSCSVQKQVEALERAGKIRRSTFKYRSIEIVGEERPKPVAHDTVPIPLLGLVAGGSPREAMQETNPELISLPTSLLPRIDGIRQSKACESQSFFDAPLFALRVVGKSMIDDGIDDGDLVIARSQSTAQNGEIVIAIVEDESATVKRFYKEPDRIRLQPANVAFEPIYSQHVQIIGKVALSIKQF